MLSVSEETFDISLFPLRTVLFPGGSLPLRIFEQRYLTMIRNCAGDDEPFGVCLIREGEEAVSPVVPFTTGTLAHIVDWFTLEDGLLGVSTAGGERFEVAHTYRQDDGLMRGTINLVIEPESGHVPARFSVLSGVLDKLMEKIGDQYPEYTPEHLDDAEWVSYRLSELLPLPAIEKQHLLEMATPELRLQRLLDVLPRFQSD
jgi:Lon protease-like protein